MKITWIGQASYLFECDGVRLAIDPYLSDALAAQGLPRLTPSPFTPETLAPDLVFCTHDHLDHFDPETIVALNEAHPDCTFWGPASVTDHCGRLGLQHSVGGRTFVPGESGVFGPFSLTALPAHHSDPHALGLLLRVERQTIYFSGDTEYREDLVTDIVKAGPVDLAFICINGRLGNMNREQAVTVMKALHPRVAIPMHYGLFEQNTADPAPFAQQCEAEGIRARLLEVGSAVEMEALLVED